MKTRLPLLFAFACALAVARAADPDPAALHAWYRADSGMVASGASVTAWENSATSADPASRGLTRIVGHPQAWRVSTPSGERAVLRLDGRSAIWQPAGMWGTLAGDRTIVALVRPAENSDGFLFDGSTRSGSSPAEIIKGKWRTAGVARPPAQPGAWQIATFVFQQAPPLGGFIMGANVATKDALRCDIAEVLVFDRALGDGEQQEVAAYLKTKWGTPVDVPDDRQPKVATLPDDPRVFRRVIRKQGDDGVHTYRIPGLATTPRGTLIAVFDIRNKGGGDLPGDIDVGAMRSTDDGATWSPMQRAIDFDANVPGSHGNGVGDPSVLVDAQTGAIFVAALWSKGARAWNGSGPGITQDETGQFVIVKSTDDGVTWSKPVSITPQLKQREWQLCFQGPGNGIQTKDGTLVFPAQFKGADRVAHSCFIFSSDHGATWKISPAAIPKAPPTSESAIAELADGSLLLSMRNEARTGKRAWARWNWKGDIPGGKWSEPWFAVTDPTCMASLIRHPHGELILSNPNNASRRVSLTIRSSRDGGKTWSKGRLLDPGFSMYSSMTVLRDGSVGILYESGDVAGLVFARFPIEWVLEGASVPDIPEGRMETTGKFGWWPARHEEKVALSKKGGIDLAFLGDSITHNWEKSGAPVWERSYGARHAANYGFGGDSTQHVLWRLGHGEFDGIAPKVVVLLIGTNNAPHGDFTPAQIAGGIRAILDTIAGKCPDSKVLLLAVFPRGATSGDPMRKKCSEINALLPALADGKRVHFLDINTTFLLPDGTLRKELMPDLLHPNARGYELWAAAMEPKLRELLGEK